MDSIVSVLELYIEWYSGDARSNRQKQTEPVGHTPKLHLNDGNDTCIYDCKDSYSLIFNEEYHVFRLTRSLHGVVSSPWERNIESDKPESSEIN